MSHTNKSDKTQTSNAAITDAAHQVALATRAIIKKQMEFSNLLGDLSNPPLPPWSVNSFLPAIITSARLFICDFSPDDVNPTTGEIPYTKATLKEVPYLFFHYPLPPRLQMPPENLLSSINMWGIDLFIRMHILIIHSKTFPEALDSIQNWFAQPVVIAQDENSRAKDTA